MSGITQTSLVDPVSLAGRPPLLTFLEESITHCGRVQLGMPQLSGIGLSETWLIEKCGEIHWAMICDRVGAPSHEIRERSGQRVYASFVALRITGDGLDGFDEGETLYYSSSLFPRSRSRFESHHRWNCGARVVNVEMLSVFCRRRGDTGNRLQAGEMTTDFVAARDTRSDLEQCYRNQVRSRGGDSTVLHSCTWQPTLALDYNGAGLLYFARYHHIVERAETSLLGESFGCCYAVEGRETYYFANLDPGESVSIGFTELTNTDRFRVHAAEIRRVRDGCLMARVITTKKRTAIGHGSAMIS